MKYKEDQEKKAVSCGLKINFINICHSTLVKNLTIRSNFENKEVDENLSTRVNSVFTVASLALRKVNQQTNHTIITVIININLSITRH